MSGTTIDASGTVHRRWWPRLAARQSIEVIGACLCMTQRDDWHGASPSTDSCSAASRPSQMMQQFAASREILSFVPTRGDDPEQSKSHARTLTDGTVPPVWLGDDPVVQLREWATDKFHPIPDVPELVIGADPAVDLPLIDPKRSMSRRHARVVREAGHWVIEDLNSRNGIKCDGTRALSKRFLLAPGMEIGLGGVTLMAENATLIRLRSYLKRVLGWDVTTLLPIDLAMRAIRATANRRAQLVLAGEDDLVAVARQIHIRTTPPAAPFIVCAEDMRESDAGVRVTATIADASTAFDRAAGGTVCVRADKSPSGYKDLVLATSGPWAAAQLFVCAQRVSKRRDPVAPPIVIPTLARRTHDDIHRIVSEYALDAMRELGAVPTTFAEREREWVAANEATTFADVEIATLRIVARNAFSLHQAAARLGVSHAALSKWFKRRRLTIARRS